MLSCNLGMRRLMDIVAVGEQVHVKVRNDMLSLLNALTKNNDRIKEFMSFSQGFELLFDIIDQEIEEYHTFIDIMPHEETFDVLGGYGTEELLEDFEFQVLVLDERMRMEEEQYEEFKLYNKTSHKAR